MILKAVKSKDPKEVLKAIADGADVNEKFTINGQTALSFACDIGHLEIVTLLLDAGADPNLLGEFGYSPLMCAAASFNTASHAFEICNLLLAQGADIEALNDDGESAIEVLLLAPGDTSNPAIAERLVLEMLKAAPHRDLSKLAFLVLEHGHVSTLELLLRNGLDIEVKDRFGYSLLHSACRSHSIPKVDFLLKAGAGYNFQPKMGWGDHPFELACRFNRIDWLEFLKKSGFQYEENQDLLQTAINSAVEEGNWDVLTSLELEGIQLAAKRGNQQPALFTAIEFNHADAVALLLERGADVGERDAQGSTPLHHAAYYGNLEILKALHVAGAEVNALNDLGWSALMQASVGGHTKIATYLIVRGAKPDQRCTATGATALFIAATEGHQELVAQLLSAGADRSLHAIDGKTAATSAFSMGYDSIVALLGGTQPHFTPHVSKGSEPICAYCAMVLPEEDIEHNDCPECDAYYCGRHYPWSDWKRPDPTSVYPQRHASCPNGHVKSEALGQ